MIRFCLASSTDDVTGPVMQSMAAAMEEGLRHCWEAWRPHLPHWAADAPPSCFIWDSKKALPPWSRGGMSRTVAIQFVDGKSRNESALAVHFVAVDRPAAYVYVDASSGINNGRHSAMESACHEAMEVLCNAFLLAWDPMAGQPGMMAAREVCDPTQRSYDASTKAPDGRPWKLASFTHPSWHGLRNPDGIEKHDHLGELTVPGAIGSEGYVILRDENWRITNAFGARAQAIHGATPGKPGGRSETIRKMAKATKRRLTRPWWRRAFGWAGL